MKLVQDHLGKAVVRVGFTQYPVGIGIADKSKVTTDVFDTCNNIKNGTALFARHVHVPIEPWIDCGNKRTKLWKLSSKIATCEPRRAIY